MYSLFTFYRSKEWRRLLDILKNERINENGEIICAYCGKPIVRAYDIIGHHKHELTEENVNDFNISLNPDNVDLVHHRCHNYIHNKFGHNMRQVYLVYGAPLSGKTSWVKDNAQEGDLIIDMDNIWQAISGLDRYQKPARLKSVAFKVRDTLLDSVKYRLGKWDNAYIIGGYPLSSERERICNDMGAREVFVEATREECINRLESDELRNKEEWTQYIDEWFRLYSPPIPQSENG